MATVRGARIVCAVVLCCVIGTACGQGGPQTERGEDDVRQSAVTFRTSDGRTLKGRLFGSGRVGVTLAHMFPADATSWYSTAEQLTEAGYMSLAFDFRGFGSSGGNREVAKAPTDIEAASAFLRGRGARSVVFMGASMGGTASIIAAATQRTPAVVAISPPQRFMGLDAPLSAINVQRPVLLLASREDGEAFSSVEELARALPNPDTRIYDGDAHGTNLLDARPEAVDEIIDFLKRYAPLSNETTPES